ncbi:hypothetical protein P4T04_18685 [Bacillus badius]|nr:hypothetical protein [Bacillus badius]
MSNEDASHPIQWNQIDGISLDQLVPEKHLVRQMKAAIDFSFIYGFTEELYSEVGRPKRDEKNKVNCFNESLS